LYFSNLLLIFLLLTYFTAYFSLNILSFRLKQTLAVSTTLVKTGKFKPRLGHIDQHYAQ